MKLLEVVRMPQPSIFLTIQKAEARPVSFWFYVLAHLLFEIQPTDLPQAAAKTYAG